MNKLARNSKMAHSGEAKTLRATQYPAGSSRDSKRSSGESGREIGQAVQDTKFEIFQNSLFWIINETAILNWEPPEILGRIVYHRSPAEKERIWEEAVEQEKTTMSAFRRMASLGLYPEIVPAENQRTRQRLISYGEEINLYDKLQFKPLDPRGSPEDLYLWIFSEFLICRNIALLVDDNCIRLQNAELAGDYISAVILEPLNRAGRENVVDMIRLSINNITAILQSFKEATPEILRALSENRLHEVDFSRIQERFRTIMEPLGFWDIDAMNKLGEIFPQQRLESTNVVVEMHTAMFSHWRSMLGLLDLIVLSYTGAHVLDMRELYLPLPGHLSMPRERLRWPGGPKSLPLSGKIQLRSLPLNCLSDFLRHRNVWVFGRAGRAAPRSRAYLSTDIETFADVWGPVWSVADQSFPDIIVEYNAGEGSIVPCDHDPTKHPALVDGERLCHWTRMYTQVNLSDHLRSQQSNSVSAGPVEGKSGLERGIQLLIGAGEVPQLRWRRCKCSIDDLTQKLKEYERLSPLMPSKAYRYVDSYQSSLVIGSHGVQVGRNRTVKDKKETPLKMALLEQWENSPSSRKPREFENYWGVVVSLCTMNAVRVRLVNVLGEESVLALLRDFEWSDLNQNEQAEKSLIYKGYKEAVQNEDPRALDRLWHEHADWREDLGKALLICFRVLVETGYHEEYREFHVLWLPPGCEEPRCIKLKPWEQSWITFLKDTTESMTVAIVVEDSFGRCRRYRDDSRPSSVQRPLPFMTPSVLQTAICVNQRLAPTDKLIRHKSRARDGRQISMAPEKAPKVWSQMWHVGNLWGKDKFWMNTQVQVQVWPPPGEWELFLKVVSAKRLMIADILSLEPSTRPGHWEFTDERSETSEFQPIPVTIGERRPRFSR